jgi:hypothetical protein
LRRWQSSCSNTSCSLPTKAAWWRACRKTVRGHSAKDWRMCWTKAGNKSLSFGYGCSSV